MERFSIEGYVISNYSIIYCQVKIDPLLFGLKSNVVSFHHPTDMDSSSLSGLLSKALLAGELEPLCTPLKRIHAKPLKVQPVLISFYLYSTINIFFSQKCISLNHKLSTQMNCISNFVQMGLQHNLIYLFILLFIFRRNQGSHRTCARQWIGSAQTALYLRDR